MFRIGRDKYDYERGVYIMKRQRITKSISIMLLAMALAGCGNTKETREDVSNVDVNGKVCGGNLSGLTLEATELQSVQGVSEIVENVLSNQSGEIYVTENQETVIDKSTINNSVDGRELPIYCVDTEEKKVALSFDAAWGNEDTKEILDILKKHNTHVTFFMTGEWVENYPEDVKAILAAGHDLGNHSENHLNMSQISDEEKEEELMAVHRKVQEITGYEMFLFRPPYGDYDNAVVHVANDCGYYAIQWDVDSLDWENEGVDEIIQNVTEHENLGNGSIILCHNGAEYTAQALDRLLTNLEGQGYTIVPVSELIYKDHYYLNHEGRQINIHI